MLGQDPSPKSFCCHSVTAEAGGQQPSLSAVSRACHKELKVSFSVQKDLSLLTSVYFVLKYTNDKRPRMKSLALSFLFAATLE